jgi:Asp-tRNA(Asn)/Glu-tRNA(Gln) amidotransferase C subunit
MDNFLYHKLSEEEKEKVKKDAKKMLDSFSDKMSKIKVPEEEPSIKRIDFEREEKTGEECDLSFKKIMFDNAPNKYGDFIIAEKKKWE